MTQWQTSWQFSRALAVTTVTVVAGIAALVGFWSPVATADAPHPVLATGVTAHRGNSGEYPENTMVAFQSALDLHVDWIELDVFLTKDGQLVVIHDATTARVGDHNLTVADATYEQLLAVDVASDFRRRFPDAHIAAKPWRVPLLQDVLQLVMQQDQTRLSIQPKVDCVPQIIELIRHLQAHRWVGFNDSNLNLMAQAKQLEPGIPVFWDRPATADITADLETAKRLGFEAMVLNRQGVTPERVQQIRDAGLEVGAWTVNDVEEMQRFLQMGVQRLYTDQPRQLIELQRANRFGDVQCEGTYTHHLQGIAADGESIYWSFTTELVKTDRDGKRLHSVPVINHHGDLCVVGDRIYVAVNQGKFNDPDGNAVNEIFVYDTETLQELSRHPVPEVRYGAGGIAYHDERFYVVGGLAPGVETNSVYEYDGQLRFQRQIEIASGYTLMGIQTLTVAGDRWLFGCYGNPATLLITDHQFRMIGQYPFDCSLGIQSLPGGRFLAASGNCRSGVGCDGRAIIVTLPLAGESGHSEERGSDVGCVPRSGRPFLQGAH